MTVDLVIANGTLVTPDRPLDSAIAIDDGEIVADPGYGEFVARERPDWDAE